MISVIIPAYNEESHIMATIKALWENDKDDLIKEIIVSDGGSTDNTQKELASEGVTFITSPVKGRAAQMNYGALQATAPILYFLHADTLPPKGFTRDIISTFNNGYEAGCYMLSFDHDHWFLKTNCWFTRFDINTFRFGDQSLFVTKDTFNKIGGFCEKHTVLEDQHIIKRLKKTGRFKVIRKAVLTSARKYLDNGIYRTQGIFFLIYFMYRLGFSQKKLVSTYRKLIREDKL